MTSSVPPLSAAGLSTMEKGGNGNGADQEEPESGPDQEKGGLLSLLQSENSETAPAPMDSNVLLSRPPRRPAGGSTPFTREKLFTAASQGDGAQLHGLLDFLQLHRKRLTSPEFKDESNGKTVLLKAFLNLKDGRNDTIEVLMDIAEKTLDSESFINAAYTDPSYKGQTALHVAIERRSLHYVKLLVQKGADVQAKASGTFFQRNTKLGFYFGELPLSLAACTNQPEVVSFLLENPHRRADPTDRDSQGNTVLHIQNNLGSTFSCKSVQNRPEMLQIEPLRSLLQDKWQRFASKLFLLNFLSYLLYLAVFTTAAFYRKDGQPPFPVENVPADHLRCLGEIISVLGAITIFRRNPPNISSLFTDGFTEILL
uniref:Transient receptor potential cation channel subfamily V member 1-like n=1 Tax=Poecilia latipinna TaxID=48699 RepID=A0A3B3TQV0_9TELE